MTSSFDETKNKIWKFLMLALQSKVDVVRGEHKGVEIVKYANSQSVSFVMPAKYKNSTEIYDFRIDKTLYHVCFNENVDLEKDQEYFNRGSRFIKHLLDEIFKKFKILVVNNVIYPNVKIDVSKFIDGQVKLVSMENVSSATASANYRYRVGFSVVVKDQIDKRITTETFSESLTMEPLNGGWVYKREALDFSESKSDGNDEYAPVTMLPDKSERLLAIGEIAALLQTNKEKQAIFNIFLNDPESLVAKHIARREESAKRITDCGEVVYRYNVTALTMYLDKVQDKIYTYELKKGGYSKNVSVRFNLKDGLKSVTCPHCGKVITPGNVNKLCLALDKDNNPVVCCFDCSIDLKTMNDLYGNKPLARYVKDQDCVISAIYMNGQRFFYIGDTYQNELDKVSGVRGKVGRRYSIQGSIIPQYFFDGVTLKNNKGFRLPNSANWIYTCPNCSSTYGRRESDKNKFDKYIITAIDDNKVVGCVNCADKPNSGKNDIYKSDLSDIYFARKSSGVKCNICRNIGYDSELTSCRVCGRYVCSKCNTGGIDKRCKTCDAYFNASSRSKKTECNKRESKSVWGYVKSNIPLYRWSMKKSIYKEIDAQNKSLYYVVFAKSNSVYCFEKVGKKYIRIYPIV